MLFSFTLPQQNPNSDNHTESDVDLANQVEWSDLCDIRVLKIRDVF